MVLKKEATIILLIVLFFILNTSVNALVTVNNVTGSWQVTAQDYKLNVTNGCINDLYWTKYNTSYNWGFGGTGTSNCIGALYNSSGSWFITSQDTSIRCNISFNNTERAQVYCYNLTMPSLFYSRWQFEDTLIRNTVFTKAAYRYYSYLQNDTGTWTNETSTNQTLTNNAWTARTTENASLLISQQQAANLTNIGLAIIWDKGATKSFDESQNPGPPDNIAIAIGRTTAIGANKTTNLTIKMIPLNMTADTSNRFNTSLIAFLRNNYYGDNAPICTSCGLGNCPCGCNITSNIQTNGTGFNFTGFRGTSLIIANITNITLSRTYPFRISNGCIVKLIYGNRIYPRAS
jgi:hypothetical protein